MCSRYFGSNRLQNPEIEKSCQELATYLLGKILVRKLDDGSLLKGRIVETEAYLGGDDKGSNTYNNRRTPASEPMYMPAGTCYVYMTYGMYHCMNISSKEPGAAVLLRALEPLCGMDIMENLRANKNRSKRGVKKVSDLCNGPSKLCISMDITKANMNKVNVADFENHTLWLEEDPECRDQSIQVITAARIGIPNAGDWAAKPLRYYIFNNECVSKRDKRAEKELDSL